MNVKELGVLKNKKGKILQKVVRITNKNDEKKGIQFDAINDLYKGLLNKYEAKQIKIVGKTLDGHFSTLKNVNFIDGDLKYVDDDYFSGKQIPDDIKKKLLGYYYSVDIEINL